MEIETKFEVGQVVCFADDLYVGSRVRIHQDYCMDPCEIFEIVEVETSPSGLVFFVRGKDSVKFSVAKINTKFVEPLYYPVQVSNDQPPAPIENIKIKGTVKL